MLKNSWQFSLFVFLSHSFIFATYLPVFRVTNSQCAADFLHFQNKLQSIHLLQKDLRVRLQERESRLSNPRKLGTITR